jgi:hypothetical protein
VFFLRWSVYFLFGFLYLFFYIVYLFGGGLWFIICNKIRRFVNCLKSEGYI